MLVIVVEPLAADFMCIVFRNKIVTEIIWNCSVDYSGELYYLLLKDLVLLVKEFSLLALLFELLAL